jgi:3-oxoadipate enol-lactonase/4-carboxymuconolactone decarboxylase
MSDAFKKGLKTRRKVLGDAWVDRSLKTRTPFNEEYQDLITRFAWNEIWNRPGLTHRERRLIVIGTMVGIGRWEEFQLHMRAALESGDLSVDDVKEILLQQVIYCGVPAANTAFREAREIAAEAAAKGKGKKKSKK